MTAQPPAAVDLSGTWHAVPSDETLRRSLGGPSVDDHGWEPVEVPGHWRSNPAFAESDGPLLYRHRFEAPAPDGGRSWLVFDGLFYQGDVWLDGCYLGNTEGYFIRHTLEVTDAVRARTEHVLAVEVTCAPQRDRTAKQNLTGVFQHWDCFDPDWNPGGIWRPVRLEHTGPVRARSLRVLCREATAEQAVVSLRAELDTDTARSICLRTHIGGVDDVVERPIAEGSNFVDWEVTVRRPRLWWPHALGDSPMEDVVVEVVADDVVSHTLHRRIGLRSLEWRSSTLTVNGERLFLKGTNQGPNRMALGEASGDELRADVALAKGTGLDLIRLHGHISRFEVYDAADDAGMLIWQDLPLQWGYARGIRRQAVRQAAAAVDLLGHHPSVAIWCGHNKPFAVDLHPGARPGEDDGPSWSRLVAAHQLPSWNKTVLDRSVKRALQRADPTRPVIAHSGVLPHAGSSGTDSHLSFGWSHGDLRDLPAFARLWPLTMRFVSQFGAQAVPSTADFLEPERWPDLDWERLARVHALQRSVFDRRVPPADHDTFESWQAATQAYQAEVIKHHVEHLRRLKYRPTGGFCQFSFADGHPGVTWSVIDHARVPKAGHRALTAACRPVIVVADRPPATVVPGEELSLDVHVVSDLRRWLSGASIGATLSWPGGSRTWRWVGDIDPDAVALVGTVRAVVPDEPGALTLDLELRTGDVTATNQYATRIRRS